LVALIMLAMSAVSFTDAKPKIIRDQCTQTSGGGGGRTCPGADDLLIRPQYEDGTCGQWMCCPSNGNGTYDCSRATNPGRAGALSPFKGKNATAVSPNDPPPSGNTNDPAASIGDKPKSKSKSP
jgi:hypothetical protein